MLRTEDFTSLKLWVAAACADFLGSTDVVVTGRHMPGAATRTQAVPKER